MSTFQIAMERINQFPLTDLVEQQRKLTVAERTKSFARNMRESIALQNIKNDSLSIIDDTMMNNQSVNIPRNMAVRQASIRVPKLKFLKSKKYSFGLNMAGK